MSKQALAGRIDAIGIDEYRMTSPPWEVSLRQVSPGRFCGRTDYVQVNGILMYREHWSHRVLATGATPPGFFTFGGTSSPSSQVDWCGAELNWRCLAYGRGSTEVDFVVPEDSCHVVALVPQGLLVEYLGEESATAVLGNGHFLQCEPRLSQQLLAMITRFADKFSAHPELLNDERVCRAVEWQLLGSLAEVLFVHSADQGSLSARGRYRALRRAVRFAENKRQPISVPELAAAAGVSQRVLEFAFQETLKVSPRKYLLWDRLNGLQRDLRKARADASSVTEIATRWGFEELGRAAVYYKELLGESPSVTLARNPRRQSKRLADALLESSGRGGTAPEARGT